MKENAEKSSLGGGDIVVLDCGVIEKIGGKSTVEPITGPRVNQGLSEIRMPVYATQCFSDAPDFHRDAFLDFLAEANVDVQT
jgi:hypothetical protein